MAIFRDNLTDSDLFQVRLLLTRYLYYRKALTRNDTKDSEYFRGLFDGTALALGCPSIRDLDRAVDRVLSNGGES